MMSSLQESLREITLAHAGDLPNVYKWVDEGNRWYELIYCILYRLSDLSHDHLRSIVEALNSLKLFDVARLNDLPLKNGKLDPADLNYIALHGILVDNGFSQEEAAAGLQAVAEAARGLQHKFEGKIQKMVRALVPALISTMKETFEFSQLQEDDEQLIFSHWLQNAFEFPVTFSNPYVERFREQNKVSLEDLVEAADELDLNMAVLDDLLRLHMLEKETGRG